MCVEFLCLVITFLLNKEFVIIYFVLADGEHRDRKKK